VGAATVAVVGIAGGGEINSAQVVVARVLAVELAGSVEAEISAKTVGVGRRALATGLCREERGPALLAGQADVGSRARIACTPDRTAIKSGRTRLSSWPHTTTTTRRHACAGAAGGTPVPLGKDASRQRRLFHTTLSRSFRLTPRPVPVRRQSHGKCGAGSGLSEA